MAEDFSMLTSRLHLKPKNAAFVAGLVFLCAQISSTAAETSRSSDDLYYLAQKSYYHLMKSPDKQKFRHHWDEVIHKFSKVAERYPKSSQARKAVFTVAKLYDGLHGVSKNAKDLDRAFHHYKKVARDFSPSTLTDDALFELARIYRDRKNFSSAARIFKTIFEKYPDGDRAKNARLQYQRLAAIVPVRKTGEPSARLVVPEKKSAPRRLEKKRMVATKTKPSADKRKSSAPLIVVDAGHGGKDYGAKSAGGVYEKNVNLIISRHVKTMLVRRFKYRVVMTRKDDTFVPLKGRSEIANNRNAELFVSIHANAAARKSAHGIETYFLGEANNERALATAARENGALVYSVKDDQVQKILASLITTTKINDSSRLAGAVQDSLFRSSKKKFRESKNLGVKEGPFYVLHGTKMPSILVEVGFLTNRKESRMLAKPDYLYGLASSIAEGVHKYMQDKSLSI